MPPRVSTPETWKLDSSPDPVLDEALEAVLDPEDPDAVLVDARSSATARITALSPGQSPPPVRMPIRLIVAAHGGG